MNGELFEIFRISIKAFNFYMFHCFNISKHISISILFFIISVLCFVGFFAGFFKIIAQGGGVLALFICPRGRILHFLCAQGAGEFVLSQTFPGEIVRLGID